MKNLQIPYKFKYKIKDNYLYFDNDEKTFDYINANGNWGPVYITAGAAMNALFKQAYAQQMGQLISNTDSPILKIFNQIKNENKDRK